MRREAAKLADGYPDDLVEQDRKSSFMANRRTPSIGMCPLLPSPQCDIVKRFALTFH